MERAETCFLQDSRLPQQPLGGRVVASSRRLFRRFDNRARFARFHGPSTGGTDFAIVGRRCRRSSPIATKNDDNARKIARCRPAIVSDGTSGASRACDPTASLTSSSVDDHPRLATADVFSPPCFLVDRRSTTDARRIPGGAPAGLPGLLLVFARRLRSPLIQWRSGEAFLRL